MNNLNRIAINTLVSFIALFIRMVIGLFSVKLVLEALGEVNYGVYIIVGGVVAMLDILNSNMTNTSMRYMSHSLGCKNKEEVYIVFSTTVFIHYIIGILSVLLLEIGGYLMFEYVVKIPFDKILDAKIIYQFMIISTFISVISVPYDAVINAHEKIWILSVFDIINTFSNLFLVIFLCSYDGNRLIMYGLFIMLLQIFMRILKTIYSKKKFDECRILKKYIRKNHIKEILSFTGWNLLGSVSALCVTHFRGLILNHFFGVRLNAAEGISRQVTNPLNLIVASMTRAINPQIMKNEGADKHDEMRYIVSMGAKYSTFIFALLGIPVLIELPFLLNIWLENIPEFTVVFCQLTIISILIEKFTFQITHAISAVGNIRNFQTSMSITNFLYLPVAWIMFKFGYPPVTIYLLHLLSLLLLAVLRLYYGRIVAGILPQHFIKKSVLPVLLPLLLSTTFAFILNNVLIEGWFNLITVSLFFIISFSFLFWFIGISKREKTKWIDMVVQLKKNINM